MLPLALIALSGLGLLLSVVTLRRMSTVQGRRDEVLGSAYARVFGVPNASISLVYFGALMAFGVMRLANVSVPIAPALAAAALSVLMSAYLATRLARLHRF